MKRHLRRNWLYTSRVCRSRSALWLSRGKREASFLSDCHVIVDIYLLGCLEWLQYSWTEVQTQNPKDDCALVSLGLHGVVSRVFWVISIWNRLYTSHVCRLHSNICPLTPRPRPEREARGHLQSRSSPANTFSILNNRPPDINYLHRRRMNLERETEGTSEILGPRLSQRPNRVLVRTQLRHSRDVTVLRFRGTRRWRWTGDTALAHGAPGASG